MKKQKSYFLVLPKNGDVLMASWKIDPAEAPKKIIKSLKSGVDLILEVYYIQNNRREKIDSIPVYGLENTWHIFTKKEYSGKRIFFTLSHETGGKITELIASKEIDVPLSETQFTRLKTSVVKNLFNLSRINLTGHTGSGKNSSW